jgi:hypothetical protein
MTFQEQMARWAARFWMFPSGSTSSVLFVPISSKEILIDVSLPSQGLECWHVAFVEGNFDRYCFSHVD